MGTGCWKGRAERDFGTAKIEKGHTQIPQFECGTISKTTSMIIFKRAFAGTL